MRLCSDGLVRIAFHLWTGGALAAAVVLALFPAAAGALTPTCAPVASQAYHGLEPVMTGRFADASLLPRLQQSYQLLYSKRANALNVAQRTLLHVLDSARTANDHCGEALAAFALGDITQRTDFAQAGPWFQRAAIAFAAVPSPLGVARSHFRLANIHSLQGHEKQSLREYAAAAVELQKAGSPVEAISARMTSLDDGADHSQEFAVLQQQASALGAPCEEAEVLRLWGDRAHQNAQYQAAMDHYQSADLLYAHCPGYASARAALQTSMGRLERLQGRPAMALPHYRLALKLQRLSGDPSYIPQTYNAMAVAYEAMGDLPRAIALYKLGLREARRLHSQPFIDFLSANLGSTYARSGHAALGIPLLEAATLHVTSDYLLCYRDDQLGNAYRHAGRLEAAAKRLDLAVAACQREDAKDALAGALADRALTEMKSDRMDAAWTDASRALAIVEEFRAHLVQTDAYKQGYISATETRSTYDLSIAILMRMKRYQEALEVAEQGRARALLDLLASGQAEDTSASTPGGAGTPAQGLIASPAHSGALAYPEMLDQAARLHSTIVAYWLTDSELYTWVARPGRPVLGVTQAIRQARIDRLVEATLPNDLQVDAVPAIQTTPKHGGRLQDVATRGAHAGSKESSAAAWRQLYTLLIAPVASALPTEDGALLTIVPSGPLFRVSFAALIDPHGHYLVERYRTHTIPMVGLLTYTQSNEAAAAARPEHYLFVAAPNHLPAGPDGQPLPALPGTATEVRAVAALLPPPEVTVLTGDQALPSRVERDAPEATYLHFATHAIVDSEHPERTYLALDNLQGGGKLTLDEVYRLHLQAKLVVLSACRTGLGKITGDGVAGLSRAFFYAGAASVLTTLWDVADRPTARMLPRFYMALEHGEIPSEALRTAQLSMLRDLRHGRIHVETLRGEARLPPSPIYWAAFALSGEP